MEAEGVEPHYQLIADRIEGADSLELKVEVTEEVFSDEIKSLQNIAAKIEAKTSGNHRRERQSQAGGSGEPALRGRKDAKSRRPEEKIMDGANVYPQRAAKVCISRGRAPLAPGFPCRRPRNPFTFFEPVE